MRPPPDKTVPKPALAAGFTLIEMAIVLVIIGLIVGGVLVGQDLIRAATVRAQISQIEKYNTAANVFKEKTGYLPGDIPPSSASQFGLFTRTGVAGDGDGNGIVTGMAYSAGIVENYGETTLFWTDLSTFHLIDGTFSREGAPAGADFTPSNSNPFYTLIPTFHRRSLAVATTCMYLAGGAGMARLGAAPVLTISEFLHCPTLTRVPGL